MSNLMIRRRSGVEHYARMISPRNWREVSILMLRACFDAAGKTEDFNTPLVLVGGVCGMATVWDEFDIRWGEALRENCVPYFHAGDFARFDPPFDIFRNNEKKRRKLVSALLDIMRDCGLRKFGALIDKPSLPKAKKDMGLETDPYMDHYVVCSRRVIDDVYAFAKQEKISPISVIFEKGDPEDLLRKHLHHNGLLEPDFRWSREFTDRKGFTHQPILGLQAAGWVAWEYYIDACRTLGYGSAPTREGRVPFQVFEQMRGNIIIQSLKNPMDRIIDQMIRETHKIDAAVKKSTARIEVAARHRHRRRNS